MGNYSQKLATTTSLVPSEHSTHKTSRLCSMENVKLTLVDLSSEVSESSESDDSLRHYIFDKNILSSARTAQQDLSLRFGTLITREKETYDDNNRDVGERLRKKIFRYVRCKDRYSALTSLLLKSQGYYGPYPLIENKEEETLSVSHPVIDLPRTKKGKPFIPAAAASEGTLSESRYSINVSHQHPFAGVAQLNPSEDENSNVGLDVVTFDKLNTRLYITIRDFLEVFRSTFTEWEWNKISSKERFAGQVTLMEFYIRWSIKEAYTKALGEGMSLDFKTFETRIRGIDDDDQDLWTEILQSGKEKGLMVPGTVTLDINSTNQRVIDVDLFFLAIESNGADGNRYLGCATVCVTPSGSHGNDGVDNSPEINWTTLEDLVAWHTNQGT